MRIITRALLSLGICLSPLSQCIAGQVALVVQHQFGDDLASTTSPLDLPGGTSLQVSRLDYLTSGFALQREGSSEWIESPDLSAYLSFTEGRHHIDLGRLPSAKFQAIRFRVGLDSATNTSDPNQYPPNHPLNPLVNDLHWGWAGGYIFMALEGQNSNGDAFTYHLANDGNSQLVTLQVNFDASRDCSIHLDFDIAKLFGEIELTRDGNSTHSREGDPIPAKLRAGIQQAFSVSHISKQRLQEIPAEHASKEPHGTPYPIQISNRLPQIAFPDSGRPTLEGVALGKKLFSDQRLSKNEKQSCASCHDSTAAFSDPGKPTSIGVDGIAGKRNAQPLFNLAWQDGFFWDGRAKSLREQVLMPITDPHELNADLDTVVEKLTADQEITAQFENAFGTPTVSADHIARALEQFLFTLISQDSKFDRAVRGDAEFTPEEKRGLELFVTEHDPARNLRGADCFHCHGGNLFTSRRYANNGLDSEPMDLGRFDATAKAEDKGKFKVPSLRNVALTAPYMHDGRFATLEDVVNHYDHGVQKSATLDPNIAKHPDSGLGLSPADKKALVAFLKTLTDQQFLK